MWSGRAERARRWRGGGPGGGPAPAAAAPGGGRARGGGGRGGARGGGRVSVGVGRERRRAAGAAVPGGPVGGQGQLRETGGIGQEEIVALHGSSGLRRGFRAGGADRLAPPDPGSVFLRGKSLI